VHVRSILTGILPLLLGGVLVNACDKEAPKTDDKKAVADDKKADAKVEDVKADAKVEDVKADVKAEDIKAADDAAAADGAAEAGAPDDVKAEDTKADPDTKAEDTKADPDTKADDKKTDAKADAKKPDAKADDKKADDKPDAAKANGKQLYADKCASCHGSSGKADTKLGEKHKIESWAEPGWKSKWSLAKVENIVTNGESGTKMKAFKDKLSPEEIKAVSKYAHGLGK
jgi:mono/diheme cytochrome c family protein